jgi:predicted DNA-binding protein
MAMISIRLNTEEEKMIDFLSRHFEEEKSSLIKHSLKDMYEDLVDRKVIDEYETKERTEEVTFFSADQILSALS